MKDALSPQELFADLGLKYFGPVDGHDIAAMESALRRARHFGGPVIVHAVTRKGNGYPPAENDDAEQMHSPAAFDPETGLPTGPPSVGWTSVFADEMVALGRAARTSWRSPRRCSARPGLAPFAEAFPDRCFDVGIAEQHALTSAAGLAVGGLHPVVALYSTFLNRAFDQLLMDVALHGQAGHPGARPGRRHRQRRAVAQRHVGPVDPRASCPGMRVAAPRDAATLREELAEAVAVDDGPDRAPLPQGPGDRVGAGGAPRRRGGRARDEPGRDDADGDAATVLLVCAGAFGELGVAAAAAAGARRASRSPWSTRAGCCRCRTRSSSSRAGHRLVVTVSDSGRHGGFGSAVADALRAAECDVPLRDLAHPAAVPRPRQPGRRAGRGRADRAGRRPPGHRVGGGAAGYARQARPDTSASSRTCAASTARPDAVGAPGSRHADAGAGRRGRAARWPTPSPAGCAARAWPSTSPTTATPATRRPSITRYDVVVLDRDLPGMSGDGLCAEIVASGATTRVLMLTASGTLADKVDGLSRGADDYLAKPFDFPELVARCRALGRRATPAAPPLLIAGDVALDPARRTVRRAERPVELTRKEFGVLEVLLGAGGAVVSSEELLERVWDENADPFTTTVRVTVMTLRKKLGDPGVIETVVGAGLPGPAPRADRCAWTTWLGAAQDRCRRRVVPRAPGRRGCARAAAPRSRCWPPGWSRWSARCCCGWAGCWSAAWRAAVPALPPGSTVRVGDRDVPAEQVSAAVGAAARDEVLRAGLIAFPLVVVGGGGGVLGAGRAGARAAARGHRHRPPADRRVAGHPHRRCATRAARSPSWPPGFDAMLDRLQAAFDAQRRFVANASHELRTPLAVLRTEVDVTLSDPAADVDELRRMGAVVRDATRRADDLDRRAAAAGPRPRRAELADRGRRSTWPTSSCPALAAVARRGRRARAADAGARRARRRRAGDPVLLERVAGNLLENAVRHNVTGGWVEVCTGACRGPPPSCGWPPAARRSRRTGWPSCSSRSAGARWTAPPRCPARGWACRSCGRWWSRTAASRGPSRCRAAACR